jgi:hypothetical protein
MCAEPTPRSLVMPGPGAEGLRFRIDPLDSDADLEGVLEVEAESFTNPWTNEM